MPARFSDVPSGVRRISIRLLAILLAIAVLAGYSGSGSTLSADGVPIPGAPVSTWSW